MVMTLVLLAVLFVAGLIHTLFSFPTKKFMAWFQSLFIKATSISQHVPIKAELKELKGGTSTQNEAELKKVKGGTTQNKVELKNVFATFDKNNDGFISKKELKVSFKNIGMNLTDEEVADMVEKVDSNGDGLIDLNEFCRLFESLVSPESVVGEGREEEVKEGGEEDLKEAFDVFDGDRDGLITVEELGSVLSSLGLKEGQRLENCKEMIKNVDTDGDGMVNFDEFKRMMRAGGRLIAVS